MKSKKTDHRSVYTQTMVKQALLGLLSQKPLNKIGVTELCSAAQINRGTFYNHFYDVFDVYESIESAFFDEIKSKLERIRHNELSKPFFKEIMLFIRENAPLVTLIIQNKTNSDFLNQVLGFVQECVLADWLERAQGIDKSRLENVLSYNIHGSLGIISDWIHSGMQKPLNEISDLITELNTTILTTFLHLT